MRKFCRSVHQSLVDAVAKGVWDLLTALAGDHQLQLSLEVERFQAGRALLQMVLDVVSSLLGQFPVEEVVQRMDRFLAV
jgi:hypothetical protein